jgi:calpain-5
VLSLSRVCVCLFFLLGVCRGGGVLVHFVPYALSREPFCCVFFLFLLWLSSGPTPHLPRRSPASPRTHSGSLSVLASNRDYLQQVIPKPKEQEWPNAKKKGGEAPARHPGVFRFRFWKFGEWHEVLVDDQLPTVNGRLLYASSRNRNEWWVPLVEKAYAKLHGSYEALASGASSEAMVDFTGGFCEALDLTKPDVLALTESRELWKKLKVATERRELMSCSVKVHDAPLGRSVSGQGLIINHAYAVLEARTVPLKGLLNLDKVRLLKIRNPW